MNRLSLIRTAKGITQETLARKVGKTRRTIINWEKDPDSLQVRNLKAVAKALNCNPQELVEWEEINE